MTCGDDACTHDYCDEKEVKTAAQALIDNGMQALGYDYVNLDDCWASNRSANGTLTWDEGRFPSGIPNLIEWLHQKGFKFGLYTSVGNETCSTGGRSYPIPGSRNHYKVDAQTFADWKVDYIKLDWCGDITGQVWAGAKAHKEFAEAVNKSGRSMFLEVVAGYWFLRSEINDYANSWRFCLDAHDQWSGQYSTKTNLMCRLDQKLLGAPQGSPGGWAHMDLIHTGGQGCPGGIAHCPGQSDDEYRTNFALWTLLQSPVIVDTDVRVMTPIMKELLLNKEILDIHQSTKTPPGKYLGLWLCHGLPGSCKIWGRPLDSKDNTKDWLVALTNFANSTHSIGVHWKTLGWAQNQQATVRDLFKHQDLPAASKEVSAMVPPHGTAYLRITAASTLVV